jgi:hypothetical protein
VLVYPSVEEGGFALTGTEAEAEAEGEGGDVPAPDAELAGLDLAAGSGAPEVVAWAVGFVAVADGDVVGTAAREAGVGVAAGDTVVAGVTTVVAAGGGLTSR